MRECSSESFSNPYIRCISGPQSNIRVLRFSGSGLRRLGFRGFGALTDLGLASPPLFDYDLGLRLGGGGGTLNPKP